VFDLAAPFETSNPRRDVGTNNETVNGKSRGKPTVSPETHLTETGRDVSPSRGVPLLKKGTRDETRPETVPRGRLLQRKAVKPE
jgi:hypothetical protein